MTLRRPFGKERLHRLVDLLPERETPIATRFLEILAASTDPVHRAHLLAPEDEENVDDDLDGGLAEARAEPSVSHEEARRRLLGAS